MKLKAVKEEAKEIASFSRRETYKQPIDHMNEPLGCDAEGFQSNSEKSERTPDQCEADVAITAPP